ncbi:LicD family protein [Litoreibacter ponti]|uniref:LicD family protein n=1 Tax=Litoreibacter ponti TaxID=1510457 RepID=A0A2T6BMG4_9RHOB|nr:LicD family protein [Litoreibacter ponti]PTX57249.1 LicD family protein [Litoreibacter ponti]
MDEQAIIELYVQDARAALNDKYVDLKPRKRLMVMDEMSSETKDTLPYREAFVLNSILGKCRPAAANRQMARLRDAHHKQGTYDEYLALEAMLADNLHGVSFGNHGFRTRNLSDADPQKLYDGIQKIVTLLKKLGYDSFINSGTLLGMIRDKGPIAYDDDIDLAVILQARTDEDAAEEFKVLLGMLLAEGIDCHLAESKNVIIKMPYIEGFNVDIFPAYGTFRRYNIFPYSRKQLTYNDVWPLKDCPISGAPLPANPERLLEENYGKDWRTPNPRFAFPWVAQKEKFAVLIEECAKE